MLATGVPVPPGSLNVSNNLVMVNPQQQQVATWYSNKDVLEPYIVKTISGVFGDGYEINLYRDSAPGEEDGEEGGDDPKGAGKGGPPPSKKPKPAAAGKKRKNGDDEEEEEDEREWEEDDQAPGIARKPRPVPGMPEPGERGAPMLNNKRPPPPRFPDTSVRKGRQPVPLDEEDKLHVRKVWNAAGKDLFRELLTVGVAVVRIYTEDDGKKSFAVIPPHLRQIYFVQNSIWPKKRYFVVYTDRKAKQIRINPDGKWSEDTTRNVNDAYMQEVSTPEKPVPIEDPAVVVQMNENNVGMETVEGGKHSLIFVMFPPDAQGNLTSPVWKSIETVTAILTTRHIHLSTAIGRAQPLHVVVTPPKAGPGGIGGGGATTTGHEALSVSNFAQGDAMSKHTGLKYKETQEDRNLFAVAASMGGTVGAEKARAMLQQLQNPAGEPTPFSYVPPSVGSLDSLANLNPVPGYLMHNIVMPPGQQIVTGPIPTSVEDFQGWSELLRSQLSMVWELPPQIMDPSGTKYATDGTTLSNQWAEKKADYATRLSNDLGTIWSVAHAPNAKKFVDALAKALKSGGDKVKAGREEYEVNLEEEQRRLKQPETKELHSILTRQEEVEKLNEQAKLRKGLRVEATFNLSFESTDPALVMQIRQMKGIDDNTAISILGAKARIPRSMLLLDEQSRAAVEQSELQSQTNTMHANMPPPPPEPKDGEKPPKPQKPFKQPAKPSVGVEK